MLLSVVISLQKVLNTTLLKMFSKHLSECYIITLFEVLRKHGWGINSSLVGMLLAVLLEQFSCVSCQSLVQCIISMYCISRDELLDSGGSDTIPYPDGSRSVWSLFPVLLWDTPFVSLLCGTLRINLPCSTTTGGSGVGDFRLSTPSKGY